MITILLVLSRSPQIRIDDGKPSSSTREKKRHNAKKKRGGEVSVEKKTINLPAPNHNLSRALGHGHLM